MTSEPSPDIADSRMHRAITEIKSIIAERYPETTFSVDPGFDPDGTSITATVDVDDTDEVLDCYLHRLTQLHVDDGLPLSVIPVQTPARLARLLADHPTAS